MVQITKLQYRFPNFSLFHSQQRWEKSENWNKYSHILACYIHNRDGENKKIVIKTAQLLLVSPIHKTDGKTMTIAINIPKNSFVPFASDMVKL